MNTPAEMMIRAVIVDDEPLARATLRILLGEDPTIELVGECASGAEAIATVSRLSPDLVFLDVQMPGTDGFAVLEQMTPQKPPAVIFVTAFDTHAVRAFEVAALDYLLKPFDDDRFQAALQRAKDRIREGRVGELARQLTAALGHTTAATDRAAATRYLERLALKESGRIAFVATADIDWIEAEDYYVEIHARGQTRLHRESLRDLEEQLDPREFVRIHRSTIVNVRRIHELRPYVRGDYIVVLHDGTELKLSRQRRPALRRLLGWE